MKVLSPESYYLDGTLSAVVLGTFSLSDIAIAIAYSGGDSLISIFTSPSLTTAPTSFRASFVTSSYAGGGEGARSCRTGGSSKEKRKLMTVAYRKREMIGIYLSEVGEQMQ